VVTRHAHNVKQRIRTPFLLPRLQKDKLKRFVFFLDFYKKSAVIHPMKRYKSKSNPELEFFVEPVTFNGFDDCYMVVAAVKGHDPTEAHSDWFKYQKDADNVARQMANES
jgi:hypothetical protein